MLSESKVQSPKPNVNRTSGTETLDFRLGTRACRLVRVSRGKNFLKYWLPVILWMSLIFSASADTRSAHHSSRIIEPVLRWLFPQLDPETINLIVFLVRKCAHVAEYAALALLVWRALRKPRRGDDRPWSWRQAGLALLIAALYAASDEIHQMFVPKREGHFHDVVIDSCGAALALVGLWAFGKWRCRRRANLSLTAVAPPQT